MWVQVREMTMTTWSATVLFIYNVLYNYTLLDYCFIISVDVDALYFLQLYYEPDTFQIY